MNARKEKSPKTIWMPLYIADYLADTLHLNRSEHGAYLLLLMAYWQNKGPLPDDDRRMAAIVRSSPQEWREELRGVMLDFFELRDGLWLHQRVEAEIAASLERTSKYANRAAAAAKARWAPPEEDAYSNATSNASSNASSNATSNATSTKNDASSNATSNATSNALAHAKKIGSSPENATSNASSNASSTEKEPKHASSSASSIPQAVLNECYSQSHVYDDVYNPKSSSSSRTHASAREAAGSSPADGIAVSDPPRDDDARPKTWTEWAGFFAAEHGIEVRTSSIHDRKKFTPLAIAWCEAGVTYGQMRRAIKMAQGAAKEPIAYLPAYVDRTLASLNAPSKAARSGLEAAQAVAAAMDARTASAGRATAAPQAPLAPVMTLAAAMGAA